MVMMSYNNVFRFVVDETKELQHTHTCIIFQLLVILFWFSLFFHTYVHDDENYFDFIPSPQFKLIFKK